jgi:hypothetical protein
MKTSRLLAAAVGGLLGIIISVVIVFTFGLGGWWLIVTPAVTAGISAVFRDKGVHCVIRVIHLLP